MIEGEGRDEGEQWLIEELKKIKISDPAMVGRRIIESARSKKSGHTSDDMTVIVARVQRRTESGSISDEIKPYRRRTGSGSAASGF